MDSDIKKAVDALRDTGLVDGLSDDDLECLAYAVLSAAFPINFDALDRLETIATITVPAGAMGTNTTLGPVVYERGKEPTCHLSDGTPLKVELSDKMRAVLDLPTKEA